MAGIKRVDFGFFDVLTKTLKTTSMKLLTRAISFQKMLTCKFRRRRINLIGKKFRCEIKQAPGSEFLCQEAFHDRDRCSTFV